MSAISFRPDRRRRRVTLNLTSLIDVLFLLLIFFMLTSTFRQSGQLQLQLPESSTSESAPTGQQEKPTHIVLRADGQVMLDGSAIDDEKLVDRLRAIVARNKGASVTLDAEAEARHADVVRLIDIVREVGFTGLSLGTEMRTDRVPRGGN